MNDILQRISIALVERSPDQRQMIEVLQSRGYTVFTRGQEISSITNRAGLELFYSGMPFFSFWERLGMSTRNDLIAQLDKNKKPLVGALCFLPFPDKRQHQSNPASNS